MVDDLIAYLFADDHVFLVPNAANTAEVVRRLAAAAPGGVTVTDEHRDFGVLAVQGPRSAELLARLGLPYEHDYMSYTVSAWNGDELVVCRTGYTGEHGYELLPPAGQAGALWDALLAQGADLGVQPCGLGARDTLRTEMGYPLHGQDLSLEITPVQARSGWAVGWKKPAFWGRDALLAERERGPARLLWGIEALERGIPRPHQSVLAGDDRGRRGHQRDVLPDPEEGHRPGPAVDRRRSRRRRRGGGRRARAARAGPRRQAAVRAAARALTRGPAPSDPPPAPIVPLALRLCVGRRRRDVVVAGTLFRAPTRAVLPAGPCVSASAGGAET